MNPHFNRALQDAQMLLAFGSSSGKDIDEAITNAIVAAGTLAEKGPLGQAEEQAFWVASNTLAKAVRPVTVSSLRATMDAYSPGDKKLLGVSVAGGSLARRAVRWYTAIAIAALACLLVLQIYWLFGASVTGEIARTNKEMETLSTKIRDRRKAENAPQDAVKLPAAATKADSRETADKDDPDVAAWKGEIKNLKDQKEASYGLLGAWSAPWEYRKEGMPKGSTAPTASDKVAANVSRMQAAIVVLEVLQKYFLPLLYGLLGSTVYVLRSLALEIQSRTYSEASNIAFRIRLYLGTLGGLVIAWFMTPEKADGILKSLSPMALAFLAGYSVELAFAAMDRIINAFTGRH
jgi:hypothetical protein